VLPGNSRTAFDQSPAFNRAANLDNATLYVVTAPVGCSTYAVINIYDVTSSTSLANVTLTTGTSQYNFTVTSAAITSGHVLALRSSTGQSGCSTNASNLTAQVQYH
jgi:hypothetical protein